MTAATAMIRRKGGRPVGIIAAAYGVKTIQGFVDRLSASSGVSLTVLDQDGMVAAAHEDRSSRLASARSDARVTSALAGGSGSQESEIHGERVLSAHAAVPRDRMGRPCRDPKATALVEVAELRSTVNLIAALIALVNILGLALLYAALRGRANAERARRAAEDQRARRAPRPRV